MASYLLEIIQVNLISRIRASLFGIQDRRLPEESTRAQRGAFGEGVAADYCQHKLSYRIIKRNWSFKHDEIDLICQDGDVLVFIEVRARAETALVSGFHSVGRRKKETLLRVCKQYLRHLKHPPRHFRFDIIDVSISKEGRGVVRHYANVSLFNKNFSVQRTWL